MSRLDELKKQYPHLNMSFFDIMKMMDTSKSYKYISLLCKLFSEKFNPEKYLGNNPIQRSINREDIVNRFIDYGFKNTNLTDKELIIINTIISSFNIDFFETIKSFIYYVDNNKIENNDVTTYSTLDEIKQAISLASIKDLNKELEKQVIKEFEDDTWTIVRPLTFQSSSKYGASTRWCTTYEKEKQYFERYWRSGILVYMINKKTGYKVAGYKDLLEMSFELSFWDAADTRTDFLSLDIDDYLYPIIKKIFSSKMTNKELSDTETQENVYNECLSHKAKVSDFRYSLNEELVTEELSYRPTLQINEQESEAIEQESELPDVDLGRILEQETITKMRVTNF